MSESLNLGAIRSQVETFLLNTSTDTASLSWSVAELNSYVNEGVLYTQLMTDWFEEFDNLVCTASVSTYTATPRVHQYSRLTWDANFLPQTNEYELDRDDPSWRSAAPNNPFRFYFPQYGQQPQVRPYPTPSQDGLSYICNQEVGVVIAITQLSGAQDNFLRPDEIPLNPAHWSSVSGFGPLNLIGNLCYGDPVSDYGFETWAIPIAANQFCEVVVAKTKGIIDVTCRSDNVGNCYFVEFGTGNPLGAGWHLYRFTAPITSTLLTSGSYSPVAGDVVRLKCVGSTLSVYVNEVLQGSVTDTNIAAGQPALGVGWEGKQSDCAVSAFYAGGITGVNDTSITFSQEFGVVIEDQDPNRSLILFQGDLPTNPFLSASREYGELAAYSTDELNIGTAYIRLPDTLVLDTDTPQMPVQCHLGLVFYALMKAFSREGEFQDMGLAKAWFDAYADWMEGVLENKQRWFSTRVRSMEPFESGSLFAKRLNAIGYPMQTDLSPSYS